MWIRSECKAGTAGKVARSKRKKYRFMHIKLHALPYNTHSYSHSHPMGGEALAALL